MTKNKLIPRKVPFYRDGKPIGFETVGKTIIGGWDRMTDAQKAQYQKQYEYDWKKQDEIYKQKLIEQNTEAFNEGKTWKTPELNIDSLPSVQRNREENLKNTYVYNNSFRPDEFDASAYWDKNIKDADETTQLETVLSSDPAVKLGLMRINNDIGINDILYGTSVKHTKNDAYYDSLIEKYNKQFGTNFRNRADLAAAQDILGAIHVDGIAGPETETIHNFYFPTQTNSWINTRKMYQNKTNKEVQQNTQSKLIGSATPNRTFKLTGNTDGLLFRNPFTYYPDAVFFDSTKLDHLNPYTRYLMHTFKDKISDTHKYIEKPNE